MMLIVLVLCTLFAGTALAQAPTTKQVGLVIAFPDGTEHLEIVTVPTAATTFDVLQKAKITLASADSGFGPAVCGINNFGCPATNCFCDATHYWAYYDLDAATSKWVASALGVGSVVPANGAVVGFAWSGFDESYNPTVQPPVYTFAQIVGQNLTAARVRARTRDDSAAGQRPGGRSGVRTPAQVTVTGALLELHVTRHAQRAAGSASR